MQVIERCSEFKSDPERVRTEVMTFLHDVSRYTDMARDFRAKMCDGIKDGLVLSSAGGGGSASASPGDEGALKRAKT